MAIQTVEGFRGQFALLSDLSDERLLPPLAQASRTVRQLVGPDFYNTVAGESSSSDRNLALAWAESCFGMYFALPSLSAPVRAAGVVQTETLEESSSQKYLDPKQVETLRGQYWDDGMLALDPYIRATANQSKEPPVTSFVIRQRKSC